MTEQVEVKAAEEVKPQVVEAATETVAETPELNETEQSAFKEGWRPKDQYKGDQSKWIEAKEFLDRKPLFEKIDSLKSESYHTRKELQEVKKTLNTLADHHQKVRETEYKRAVDDLKIQRRLAVEDKDMQAVEAIEEKMDAVKEERTAFEQQMKAETKTNVEPTPEYVGWVKENPWYHTDKEMHDFADGVAASHMQRNPRSTPNEVFEYVTKQARRAFPDQFASERKARPSSVDSGDNSSRTSTTSKDDYKLSPEEDEVARRFERSGVMTRKEYAAEMKRLNNKR